MTPPDEAPTQAATDGLDACRACQRLHGLDACPWEWDLPQDDGMEAPREEAEQHCLERMQAEIAVERAERAEAELAHWLAGPVTLAGWRSWVAGLR